jgi:hypothetical protein
MYATSMHDVNSRTVVMFFVWEVVNMEEPSHKVAQFDDELDLYLHA